MNALAFALSFVIVAQETAPPEPAEAPADDVGSARPEPAATQGEASAPDPATAADEAEAGAAAPARYNPAGKRALTDMGRVGLGMIASGAVVAASTAAGATLIEAMTKNDTDPNAPADNPELVQVGGFATLTLMSLSAGAMLIGSALVVNDVLAPGEPDSPQAGAE